MPQLFPMNWIILSIMFMIILIINFINIYFFPLNSMNKFIPKNYNKKNFFKW